MVSALASRKLWLALLSITLLGAALRFYGLAQWPPGLYQDEGGEGVDALRVLQGETPIYFEDNFGREPLWVYGIAVSIAMFGRTPFALRAVAALAGTLAIPATYLAVRELFGRKMGLLAALVFATSLWGVLVGRLGLRVALIPLFLSLGAWAVARAWHRDHWWDWAMAGVLCGLSLYTYLPARLLLGPPVVLAALAGLQGPPWRKLVRGGLLLALFYGLTALPLGVYTLTHWEVVNGRLGQVSILNPDNNQGQVWMTFLHQSWLAVQMFFGQGDMNLRHNVNGLPVFNPFLVGLCGVGLGVGLRHWRERRWQWVGVWVSVFWLPTVLADSAPHFLRAAGMWPFLAVLPAAGGLAVVRFLRQRVAHGVALGVGAVLVGSQVFTTVQAYFWSGYLTSPATAYAFDAFAAELAATVNRFTGVGWQGEAAPPPTRRGDVWIDPRLYRFTKTVEFLIPQNPDDLHATVHWLTPASVLPSDVSAMLVVVPGEEQTLLAQLPTPSFITLAEGALVADPTPFRLFRTLVVEPVGNLPTATVCFGDDLELLPPHVTATNDTVHADLRWRLRATATGALPDATIFLHVYQAGALVGQNDAAPVQGLWPLRWLRPGDVIADPRLAALIVSDFELAPQSLGVGVYDATGQRWPLTNCAGQVLGDELFLP